MYNNVESYHQFSGVQSRPGTPNTSGGEISYTDCMTPECRAANPICNPVDTRCWGCRQVRGHLNVCVGCQGVRKCLCCRDTPNTCGFSRKGLSCVVATSIFNSNYEGMEHGPLRRYNTHELFSANGNTFTTQLLPLSFRHERSDICEPDQRAIVASGVWHHAKDGHDLQTLISKGLTQPQDTIDTKHLSIPNDQTDIMFRVNQDRGKFMKSNVISDVVKNLKECDIPFVATAYTGSGLMLAECHMPTNGTLPTEPTYIYMMNAKLEFGYDEGECDRNCSRSMAFVIDTVDPLSQTQNDRRFLNLLTGYVNDITVQYKQDTNKCFNKGGQTSAFASMKSTDTESMCMSGVTCETLNQPEHMKTEMRTTMLSLLRLGNLYMMTHSGTANESNIEKDPVPNLTEFKAAFMVSLAEKFKITFTRFTDYMLEGTDHGDTPVFENQSLTNKQSDAYRKVIGHLIFHALMCICTHHMSTLARLLSTLDVMTRPMLMGRDSNHSHTMLPLERVDNTEQTMALNPCSVSQLYRLAVRSSHPTHTNTANAVQVASTVTDEKQLQESKDATRTGGADNWLAEQKTFITLVFQTATDKASDTGDKMTKRTFESDEQNDIQTYCKWVLHTESESAGNIKMDHIARYIRDDPYQATMQFGPATYLDNGFAFVKGLCLALYIVQKTGGKKCESLKDFIEQIPLALKSDCLQKHITDFVREFNEFAPREQCRQDGYITTQFTDWYKLFVEHIKDTTFVKNVLGSLSWVVVSSFSHKQDDGAFMMFALQEVVFDRIRLMRFVGRNMPLIRAIERADISGSPTHHEQTQLRKFNDDYTSRADDVEARENRILDELETNILGPYRIQSHPPTMSTQYSFGDTHQLDMSVIEFIYTCVSRVAMDSNFKKNCTTDGTSGDINTTYSLAVNSYIEAAVETQEMADRPQLFLNPDEQSTTANISVLCTANAMCDNDVKGKVTVSVVSRQALNSYTQSRRNDTNRGRRRVL